MTPVSIVANITMNKQITNDLLSGDIDPNTFFRSTGPSVDFHEAFDYPIENFGVEGSWAFNNSDKISERDIALFKKLIYSVYDESYFSQRGCPAGDSWYIIANVGEYYISFEASCTLTDFLYGGGSFNYASDWKTLWNLGMTNIARQELLIANGYKDLVGKINI